VKTVAHRSACRVARPPGRRRNAGPSPFRYDGIIDRASPMLPHTFLAGQKSGLSVKVFKRSTAWVGRPLRSVTNLTPRPFQRSPHEGSRWRNAKCVNKSADLLVRPSHSSLRPDHPIRSPSTCGRNIQELQAIAAMRAVSQRFTRSPDVLANLTMSRRRPRSVTRASASSREHQHTSRALFSAHLRR